MTMNPTRKGGFVMFAIILFINLDSLISFSPNEAVETDKEDGVSLDWVKHHSGDIFQETLDKESHTKVLNKDEQENKEKTFSGKPQSSLSGKTDEDQEVTYKSQMEEYNAAFESKSEQKFRDLTEKETVLSAATHIVSKGSMKMKDVRKDSSEESETVKASVSEPNNLDDNEDENSEDHENINQEVKNNDEADMGLKKQRYFPLLYTFGTLFNSFLSEFGDVSGNQDLGYNSSEKENKNSSMHDQVWRDSNITFNNSDSGKKTRFQCALRNVTGDTIFEVKIVNSTELLEILNSSKNQKLSSCVLVMFYAPWCYFCAQTAPYYNALARAFPQLNILAVDTSHFSYLNARFGTVAVPNVMLFHSRSAVRFNHTVRDLEHFILFVTNNTGLEANKSVTVEPCDYQGPLSSQVVQKRDWLLWLAWAFVITCSTYGFIGSFYGQALFARVRVLWQEHQHIE